MHKTQSKSGRTGSLTAARACYGAAIIAGLTVGGSWIGSFGFNSLSAIAADLKQFTVTSPLQLTSSPSLMLVKGTVHFNDAAAAKVNPRALGSKLDTGDLLLTNARFIFIPAAPNKIRGTNAEAPPANLVPPLLQALAKFGFSSLNISDSEIIIASTKGKKNRIENRKIENISARLTRASNGIIKAAGSFHYGNQPLRFSASFDSRRTSNSHGLVPLTFSIDSPVAALSFTGTAGISNGMQLQGKMRASAPDLRAMAHWLTGKFPAGPGLKNLKISGAANLIGTKLSFAAADFELDGNKASGGLSLDFGKERPKLEGTLAAQKLLLDPYFAPSLAANKSAAGALLSGITPPKPDVGDTELNMPSLLHFDADMRLSANSMQLAGYSMGQAAIAVSLSKGKLLADVAEIELAGGRGIGQITADMSGQVPQFSIQSKFDNIDVGQFTKALISQNSLSGEGQILLAVKGAGRTFSEFVRALSGKIQLILPDGGYLGVDPAAMMRAARISDLRGWKPVRSSTRINKAIVHLSAQNGILTTQEIQATAGKNKYSCTGKINLPQRSLDLSIQLGTTLSLAADEPPGPAKTVEILRVYGQWQRPVIRLEQIRKKALMSTPPAVPPGREKKG